MQAQVGDKTDLDVMAMVALEVGVTVVIELVVGITRMNGSWQAV